MEHPKPSRFLVLAPLPPPAAVARALPESIELAAWESYDPSAEGLFISHHARVDGRFLDRFPAVRVVSNYGVGVDHIDLAAARERGVPVGNTSGVLDGAVADLAIGLVIAAARRVVEADRLARSGASAADFFGNDVHHATLGLLGMGRIGRQIARRARAFDMTVLYHSRRRNEEAETQLGVVAASKENLLANADYVVLAVPLSAETRGMIGAAELAQMKPDATLINISRGPLVDTGALTEALIAGRLRSAALDVTDPEPLPTGHPLLSLPNVTLTPHLGSATYQTRRAMAELAVANLLAGLEGRALPCQA